MSCKASYSFAKTATKKRGPIWSTVEEEIDLCGKLVRCKDCLKVFKNADATSIKRHREAFHKEGGKRANGSRGGLNQFDEPNNKERRDQSALATALSTPVMPINSFTHPFIMGLMNAPENTSKFLQLYKTCFPDHVETKLVVLGGGKMASALVEGFVKAECFKPKNISICCRSEATAQSWQQRGFVAYTPDTFYDKLQPEGLILVAVKPQVFSTLVTDLTSHWTLETAKCIVVSIMAGVSFQKLGELAVPAIRMMPNMSCAIGEGTLITCAPSCVPMEQVELVVELGSSVGYSVHVDEKVFDAAASLTGCGIAFIFMVMEALADGAVSNGVARQLATKLSAEMVKGAAQLFLAGDKHFAQLKDEVCSPGGTTIAGVRELEKNGMRSAMIEAIHASTNRAQELAKLAEKQ